MAIERIAERDEPAFAAAGQAAAQTLALVGRSLQPGMTTADIDRIVRKDTARHGGQCSQLGYHGFPAAVCTSVNDVVCHGIPSERQVLQGGDIVNVDVTTYLGGFHGDTSRTFVVGGQASDDARHVVDVAQRCFLAGIAVLRDGIRLGDVGAAIEEVARTAGCSIVREYGGHGIGRVMHTEPHVSHFGRPGRGLRLRKGMAITIEPMVNAGRPEVRLDDDGWTVRTADGSLSAQFEHTLLITQEGCRVLTALQPANLGT